MSDYFFESTISVDPVGKTSTTTIFFNFFFFTDNKAETFTSTLAPHLYAARQCVSLDFTFGVSE